MAPVRVRFSKRRFASLSDDAPFSRALIPLKKPKVGSSAVRSKPAAQTSLMRQVKALIASKKRDASDVARDSATFTATTVSCLTSGTAFATAADGNGIVIIDGDECMINSVRIRALLELQCLEDVTPVGLSDVLFRQILIWFNKPKLQPSAAGTLPPITEILVTDALESEYVTETNNAGSFVVLSDKTWNMGTNTVAVAATGAYPRSTGASSRIIDYMVKIGKRQHYRTTATSSSGAGNYDSDNAIGQVDKGLLCLYQLHQNAAASGTLVITQNTRLNYTG